MNDDKDKTPPEGGEERTVFMPSGTEPGTPATPSPEAAAPQPASGAVEPPAAEPSVPLRPARAQSTGRAGVLVVGVESLLTQLARCCRPAPPDAIGGYVTRGQGVAIHRHDCSNFRQMAARNPERLIPVTWGEAAAGPAPVYPVDVSIAAGDRPGLLRDISEVFAKEKMNVTGVNTQTVRGTASMTFTLEVSDAARLAPVLESVARVAGVRWARRR